MSVKIMVLGVLSDSKESHGYTILRQLNAWRADMWTNIKPGSVYHALAQFEKHGLVINYGEKKGGGPSATSYAITEKGRKELHMLIEKALVSYDQEEFAAGLAWMKLLTRSEATALARQRLDMYQQTCVFMRTLPQDSSVTAPAQHPEIIGSWMAIFEATAAWQQAFVRRLETGAYTFREE